MRVWKKPTYPEISNIHQLRKAFGLTTISVSSSIFNDAIESARKFPRDEEGGVLIGFLDPMDMILEKGEWKPLFELRVVNFIPSGPRTERSSGSLFSDIDFQEDQFKKVFDTNPNIIHAGSWHSHHCNMVSQLSHGDVRSYLNMLTSPNHSHDYYFAILLLRLPPDDISTNEIFQYFKFYLLSRHTGTKCFEIAKSCLHIRDQPEDYSNIIEYDYEIIQPVPSEPIRPSWYMEASARAILKSDNLFFKRVTAAHGALKKEQIKRVKGIGGFGITRTFTIGKYTIEYAYPESSMNEGIKIKLAHTTLDHMGNKQEIVHIDSSINSPHLGRVLFEGALKSIHLLQEHDIAEIVKDNPLPFIREPEKQEKGDPSVRKDDRPSCSSHIPTPHITRLVHHDGRVSSTSQHEILSSLSSNLDERRLARQSESPKCTQRQETSEK